MVSVIIPIYNASKYLRKCIDSILTQSFQEFEIILINDASTDDSLKICQSYASIHHNIIVHSNDKNKGLYLSRIIGISLVKGDYITFLDSDDWLSKDTLLQLMKGATATHAEIVQMRYRHRVTAYNIPVNSSNIFSTLPHYISSPTLQQNYIQSFLGDETLIPVTNWGKLYSVALLKNIPFPIINQFTWGEDQFTNLLIFHCAKSFAVINYCGYNYRWGGHTRHHKIENIDTYDRFLPIISKKAIELGYSKHIYLLRKQNDRFFRYHIRHCISTLKMSRELIITHIVEKRHVSVADATKIYTAEKNNIAKHFYKNLIKHFIS